MTLKKELIFLLIILISGLLIILMFFIFKSPFVESPLILTSPKEPVSQEELLNEAIKKTTPLSQNLTKEEINKYNKIIKKATSQSSGLKNDFEKKLPEILEKLTPKP